jgi:hypothetical protein
MHFLFLACVVGYDIKSQELEPRVYAALPKNLNSVAIAYGLSKGNVLIDPALPVSNLKLTMHNAAFGYVRTFGLGSKLARIQVTVPFFYMIGKLQIDGRDTSASRNGFGDTRLRFGINLTGTPVLDKRDFRSYTQKTIVGVSLVTSLPTGLYHSTRRINSGSNRFALKPEIGISKRIHRIYAEVYSGVWFYTVNNKYLGNKTLDQNPVFSLQTHISYYFKNMMWVSFNTTWFKGGKTIVNDISTGDKLDNWRAGATWSVPIAKGQSVKLQFHVGAFTEAGYDYNVVLLAYQYVF